MELRLIKYYFPDPYRSSSLLIGWFDIVCGHVMVVMYLVSMYSGYFNDSSGTYTISLWLDFLFAIVQLIGGAVLVYGVRNKIPVMVLTSAVVGVSVLTTDLVADILLECSLVNVSWFIYLLLTFLLLVFIGIRSLMVFAVYSYFKQLQQELALRQRLDDYIPENPQISTFS